MRPASKPHRLPLQRVLFVLLQLRVLGFGLPVDGNVRIGIFPEGEEVLIRLARGVLVAHHLVSAGKLKMSQGTVRLVQHYSRVLDQFVELHYGVFSGVLPGGMPLHVHRFSHSRRLGLAVYSPTLILAEQSREQQTSSDGGNGQEGFQTRA